MTNRLFEKGREGFLDGTCDWDTNTFSAALLDLNVADVGVKQIASSTNATPIVVTATAHGFANGDFVFIDGHATNTAANGLWQIGGVAANTFNLLSFIDGTTNSVGNGVGGATGYAVCLGPSAAGDNWDDFDGCLVGAKVALTTPTVTNGVADAADTTFTAVSGATVEAVAIFKDTGVTTTSRMVALITGKFVVVCNTTAAAAATAISVEPLVGGLANGATIVFSNGASATLSAGATAGARSITVSALAAQITAGSYALGTASPASGLPVTPNSGNISITYDNGANRIFKL